MKKLVLLLCLVGCSYPSVYITKQTDYDYQKSRAKTFPWYTNKVFDAAYKESKILPIRDAAFFVMCVIDAETGGTGKPTARGKRIKIKYRKKWIRTRAIGLMQIIPEYWVKKKDKHRLVEPQFNIHVGVKALKEFHHMAKGNLKVTLKNYNSGPHKRYYNWKYIDAILNNYYGAA